MYDDMTLHTDNVLHTTYVREEENGSSYDKSRFICKCHIFKFSFVRTFRWRIFILIDDPSLRVPTGIY